MSENVNGIIGAIEALLFVAADPVPIEVIKELFCITEIEAISILEQMKNDKEVQKTGIILRKVAEGYQLCTNPIYSEYVSMLSTTQRRQPLSQAALETLSIIAYKQPITRSEIESIRGVKSFHVVALLLEKGLVEKVGVKNSLGHPSLLGTTDEFLMHFGLECLDDLPKVESLVIEVEHEV